MPDFVYTTVPGKLKSLLDKIRVVGVPSKATATWLQSISFTSSNDKSLLGVLKQIGFCDQSGQPTDLWRRYRGAENGRVMAEGIRAGFAELFEVYPDAWQRSDSELFSFFNTRSNAGKQSIDKTVSTFKALIALADFSGTESVASGSSTIHHPNSGNHSNPGSPSNSENYSNQHQSPIPMNINSPMPALHIDIQIHIASDASLDQIDQIFASMSKHLYKSSNDN